MADAPKPYGDVKYADPKNGKYPVDTEAHAKAAWSYINMPKNAAQYPMNGVTLSEVKDRIMAACKKFGITIDSEPDADDSSRAEFLNQSGPYYRSFPLEDIHVRSGGDGRTVEAYAAVFGVPAKVKDQDGTYMEEIDPTAFNRAISDAAPHGSRRSWKVGVFYNHGMTLWGTPSEKHSFPVGVPLDIAVDGHGLKTVTRYHRGEFCDQILEAIREGSIGGYSFTGDFKRSTPQVPRGGFRPSYRTGDLPLVRRLESTLVEYGPTPVPVYEGAAVTAMRAMNSSPELAMQMLSMFRDGAPEDSPPQTGAPETGLAAEDSPSRRSGRSVKQEIQAARSEFLQRYRR